jgi:HAD superfamily hydrolase (TIGR01549 family)
VISPRALLLDFGGVIADAPREDPAAPELVRRLSVLVGGALPEDRIARDLVAGAVAYARWRNDAGTQAEPRELTHAEVWDDFVAAAWPTAARAAIQQHASSLAYAWTYRPEWTIRPGIPEVFAAAAARGIPVAVVSNTLCGAAHRDFLAQTGLSGAFETQLYSDELGVRKPNPEMARRAAREMGVAVEHAWFVGDSYTRDIACARRAGVGAAILMRSPRTDRDQRAPGLEPDAVVEDGHGLCALMPQPPFGRSAHSRTR